jgi:NitT/TauT family transport system substrate-binding protein
MKRYLTYALSLLIFFAPFAGRVSAADDVSLRLDFYAHASHPALAYGIEKGIYAQHGINLKLLEGTGSGPTTQLIASGTERFGYVDAFTMAKLASKGLPVKMIATYTQNSVFAIVTFEANKINTLRDLYGKKVAFTSGDAQSQLFPALMSTNGLDVSKVNIVYLAPEAKTSALIVGTVDAMGGSYADQAGVIQKEAKRKVTYIRYADMGANTLSFGLIVNTKYLGDRALNCRMVAATSASFAAALKDPQGASEALLKMFPRVNRGDNALTNEQWLQYSALVHTDNSKNEKLGYMSPKDWTTLVTLGTKYGDFAAKPATDYYTNDFIDCK